MAGEFGPWSLVVSTPGLDPVSEAQTSQIGLAEIVDLAAAMAAAAGEIRGASNQSICSRNRVLKVY